MTTLSRPLDRQAPPRERHAAPGASRSVAGDGLLHPVVLAAIGMLILNDHLLKATAPGLVTGKLSDVAGMLFFPLLIVAGWELLLAALGRWRRPSRRALAAAVAMTAVVFAGVKTTAIGAAAFGRGLGILQWVVGLAWSGIVMAPQAGFEPTAVAQDPSDLIALVALVAATRIGIARVRRGAISCSVGASDSVLRRRS
jgi:hypothetical protein